MEPISVFVCESQPIVLEGLEKVLAATEDFKLVGAAGKLSGALEELRKLQPAIFLTDHSFGTSSVYRFISMLKAESIQSHVVLWATDLSEADTMRAMQLGIRAIVKKTAPVSTLLECLREVSTGRIWMEESSAIVGFLQRRETSRLTPREQEVVRLVCEGMKNKQIAARLGITPGTVKVHLMHIFEKTGLKDRYALAVHGRSLPGIVAAQPGQAIALKIGVAGVDET